MPTLTEPELIAKACAGDHQSFRELVIQYERLVYSIAFRFTRNQAEAEDLAQECFIKLWKNLERYKTEFAFKTWLGKIITNLCLDHLKSTRNKMEKQSMALENHFEISGHQQEEKELHSTELHQIVLQLAELLTPKQKATFILRDMEMLDVSEVCEILNESAENIKSNLYHARKNIRENLLKYYKTSLI